MPADQLTDTQLVVLSSASQREDRCVVLPATLRGGAARKVVFKLIERGFISEIPARGEMPAWRRNDENRPMALRITRRGLNAIQVEDNDGQAEECAGDAVADRAPAPNQAGHPRPVRSKSKRSEPKTGSLAQSSASGRSRSKQAQIIELLRRPQGASVAAVMAATGWQQHSVRGFFAGAVRKRLGLALVSEKINDERVYRIVLPDAAKGARKKSGRRAG